MGSRRTSWTWSTPTTVGSPGWLALANSHRRDGARSNENYRAPTKGVEMQPRLTTAKPNKLTKIDRCRRVGKVQES